MGHFIHQLVIILLSFLTPVKRKMQRRMMRDILLPSFPLLSAYDVTEFLAPCVLALHLTPQDKDTKQDRLNRQESYYSLSSVIVLLGTLTFSIVLRRTFFILTFKTIFIPECTSNRTLNSFRSLYIVLYKATEQLLASSLIRNKLLITPTIFFSFLL